jgi:hypothetical protein
LQPPQNTFFEYFVSKNHAERITKTAQAKVPAPLIEDDQGTDGSPVSLVRESDLRTLAERKAGARGSRLLTRFLSVLVFLLFSVLGRMVSIEASEKNFINPDLWPI